MAENSAVAVSMPFTEGATSPDLPDRNIRPDDERFVAFARSLTDVVWGIDREGSSVAGQERTRGAVAVRRDENGMFIAEDLLGAIYGLGSTVEEAEADFYETLDAHLADLRAHRDSLHERLAGQLARLERLFPGR